MKLKRTPEFLAFLSTHVAHAEMEADVEAARAFADTTAGDRVQRLSDEIAKLIGDAELPVDELGSEGNRWFADADEARAWLRGLAEALASHAGGGKSSGVVVKDSNGAVLAEGDAVTVIKDLKVKGGSSDLKRGTVIRKIHLVDDPEVVECRVDGSTLVLKTCFLKKA